MEFKSNRYNIIIITIKGGYLISKKFAEFKTKFFELANRNIIEIKKTINNVRSKLKRFLYVKKKIKIINAAGKINFKSSISNP
jgi:hypothetical protein